MRNKDEMLSTIKEHPILTLNFFLFLLVFFISPYLRGLFFYEDRYIFYCIFLVLILLNVIFQWDKYIKVFTRNYIIVGITLLIPIMYFVSYFFSASKYYAINEVLYWVVSIAVFLFLVGNLFIVSKLRDLLWWTLWMTISWIIGLAFLAHLDILEYQDALVSGRLSSVFQYPNTFASLVSAFVIGALYLSVKEKNIKAWFIYSLTILPFFLSFLMAESRGGYLVFAICWVLVLFFLKVKEQILFVVFSLLAGVLTLITLFFYQNQVEQANTAIAASILVICSLVYVLASYGVFLIYNRKINLRLNNTNKKLSVIIPFLIVIIIIGGVFFTLNSSNLSFLPNNIQERISKINLEQHSVQERFLFYKDSILILTKNVLFGAGGGAWGSLFEQYKSLPYQSSQAHSFYMQTLVEVGVVGGTIVFLFFILIMFQAVRTITIKVSEGQDNNFLTVYFLMIITLMLHNFVDFNMSFATYHYFTMIILALLVNEINRLNQSFVFEVRKLSSNFKSKVSIITLSSFLIIVLLGAYKSYALYDANDLLKQASFGGDFSTLSKMVDKGIDRDPTNPDLRFHRLVLLDFAKENIADRNYNQDIAREYESLIDIEPFNSWHYYRYGLFELDNGDTDKAIKLIKKSVEHSPWNTEFYKAYFSTVINHMTQRRDDISEQDQSLYLKELTEQLEKLNERIAIQETKVPKGLNLTSPIIIDDELAINIAKVYYFTGKFKNALMFIETQVEEELDEAQSIQLDLIRLLSLDHLGKYNKIDEFFNSAKSVQYNIRQIYEEAKTSKDWQPFVKK